MKILRDRRGAVHTLEALFATAILLSTLLYSNFASNDQRVWRSFDLEYLGLQILISLDGNGALGSFINKKDWGSLEECLRSMLPPWVSFDLTIYKESKEIMNDHPISNGGLIGLKVVSVDYLCAVRSGLCELYRVRLCLG